MKKVDSWDVVPYEWEVCRGREEKRGGRWLPYRREVMGRRGDGEEGR